MRKGACSVSETAKNLREKIKGLFNPPVVIWPTRNKALRQTGVVLGVALAVSLLMLTGEAVCGLLFGLIL